MKNAVGGINIIGVKPLRKQFHAQSPGESRVIVFLHPTEFLCTQGPLGLTSGTNAKQIPLAVSAQRSSS